MKRQDLEIFLSRSIAPFSKPKLELEQYQTPPALASHLLHRAFVLGDISEKVVIDLCAGTGIFSIGAMLLGAKKAYAVEIDPDAIDVLQQNCITAGVSVEIVNDNALTWRPSSSADTVFINPPFGIQQKKNRDAEFIKAGFNCSNVVYAVVDGVSANIDFFSSFSQKHGWRATEYFQSQFPLVRIYAHHRKRIKYHNILTIRFERT